MNILRLFLILLLPVFISGLLSSCSFQKHGKTTHSIVVNPMRYDIVKDARDAIGSGYRYGATGHNKYDCSGLVYSLYSVHEIMLPRSTQEMARYGEKIRKENLLPGDLVFFRHAGKIDHVAMVSRMSPAQTWLIHSTTSRGVIEEVLESSPYWTGRLDQFRRVIP